ncbi:MAG: TspO/MBR family protein [Bacilli bacterium]|jgi:benzodiazapine receptor
MKRRGNYKFFTFPLGGLFLLGILFSIIISRYLEFYNSLKKPFFNISSFLFLISYPFLYLLMGFGVTLIIEFKKRYTEEALFLFMVQIIMSFFWIILFFSFKTFFFSFLWLLILIIIILLMMEKFYLINKGAVYFLVPYFMWLFYCLYLNFFILILN